MSDIIEETVIKEKTITAKRTSHASQIVAALWIAGWASYAFISGNALSMTDIITSGIAIMASFSPIYLNILMDKIRDIKLGGK